MDDPKSSEPQRSVRGQVTVSIVSHGQGALVSKLLADLDTVSHESIAKAVVTLNIAEPALKVPQCRFPVEIIANDKRKGFGANHNAAFLGCSTEWFLVLNPDLALPHDPIAPLISQSMPRAGVLAPRIIEPRKAHPEPHRKLLTPAELILRRARPENPVIKPDWVAGMFMLFRTEVFKQVGGFDTRYFMYVEDADICARIRLAGWQIFVADSVCVIHDARRTSWRQWRALTWHLASLAKWWTSAAFWRSLTAEDGRRSAQC